MNMVKPTLNTCFNCHKGPTSKANHQKKQIAYRNLIKIKFFQISFEKILTMNIKPPKNII